MKKTILITGVAGLLGSRLADWIIENKPEYKVVGIDDLSGGYKENVNPKVEFWQMNLVEHPIENCFEVNKFDYVFVNSNYAKKLIENIHDNIIVVPFFSLDRCFFPKHTSKIIHFKGKSIQKNTELIKNYSDINIIDSESKYLTENEVVYHLNNHDIHICCSLYESWGHYLWEAMSCGKLVICSEIPVFKEYLDADLIKFVPITKIIKNDITYKYLNDMNYPFREGHFIDENKFDELLNNKEELFEFQKKNCDNIRQHFLDVNKINKQKFLDILKYII